MSYTKNFWLKFCNTFLVLSWMFTRPNTPLGRNKEAFICALWNSCTELIRKFSWKLQWQSSILTLFCFVSTLKIFQNLFVLQFNVSLLFSQFLSSFKCANIPPIFKNESRNYKNNYRPVSVLPVVWKIFDKNINKQLSIYFENAISKFLCGNGVYNDKVFGALLTDLSEAFDCIYAMIC